MNVAVAILSSPPQRAPWRTLRGLKQHSLLTSKGGLVASERNELGWRVGAKRGAALTSAADGLRASHARATGRRSALTSWFSCSACSSAAAGVSAKAQPCRTASDVGLCKILFTIRDRDRRVPARF
eukprot:scaffold107408_cov63-Phaeocystis_antarctica.AAC.1